MTKPIPLVGRSNSEKAAVEDLLKARALMKEAKALEERAKATLHDSGHRIFETETHIVSLTYETQRRLDTETTKAYLLRQNVLDGFLRDIVCEKYLVTRKDK